MTMPSYLRSVVTGGIFIQRFFFSVPSSGCSSSCSSLLFLLVPLGPLLLEASLSSTAFLSFFPLLYSSIHPTLLFWRACSKLHQVKLVSSNSALVALATWRILIRFCLRKVKDIVISQQDQTDFGIKGSLSKEVSFENNF